MSQAERLLFDTRALFDALDSRRLSEGLTWAGLSRIFGVNAATLKRTRLAPAVLETDGMLQMVRWLGRTPESFCGLDRDGSESAWYVANPSDPGILRVDSKALFRALDEKRTDLGLSWASVAKETGVPLSTLTGLPRGTRALGARTNATAVVRMAHWLGRSVESFTLLLPE